MTAPPIAGRRHDPSADAEVRMAFLRHFGGRKHHKLTLRQRTVMRLIFVEGLSVAATAERLNLGTSAVKDHVKHAKERLGKYLPREVAAAA